MMHYKIFRNHPENELPMNIWHDTYSDEYVYTLIQPPKYGGKTICYGQVYYRIAYFLSEYEAKKQADIILSQERMREYNMKRREGENTWTELGEST